MSQVRAVLIGAGAFGRNHARALAALPDVHLAGIFDSDHSRAAALGMQYRCAAFPSLDEALAAAECAVVATPTVTHSSIATQALEAGLHVLVEKPIADTAEAGRRLDELARSRSLVLQVGHLERFNPAITALRDALTVPLFFEIHRLSMFTPRSLDVDVVLDLMIHDLDIVLTCVRETPDEVRAAGISVLSPLVDIANVRLSFPSGCIANLTASRVSTEKIRKLRLFQPGEYISVDYGRQDALRLAVGRNGSGSAVPQIDAKPLPVTPGEPLLLEVAAFIQAVRTRSAPPVTAKQATDALALAETILAKIQDHARLVTNAVRQRTAAPDGA